MRGSGRSGQEALFALSADSREDVDRLRATALAHGGSGWKPDQDHAFMDGASFADPDGHVREAVRIDPAALAG